MILDNALKLSNDVGICTFGRQAWEREVARVRESKLWEELLEAVNGAKASISAEVIMAMYVRCECWADVVGFRFRCIMGIRRLRN